MRKRDHNVFANGASLLICGLLAGVVVAAAAFPAVAMSGLAAKAGAETFDKLPTELTVKMAPQISYLYASDGKTLLATMYDENRQRRPAEGHLADACRRPSSRPRTTTFYEHNGVDVKGVARAFVANNSAGETTQGASTLTMQYVRHVAGLLGDPPAGGGRRPPRTPPSARSARCGTRCRSRSELTKEQILERYLNIAPFGNGAYGIFAASQVYFNKQPEGPDDRRGGAARRHGQGALGVRPDHRRAATRRRWTRRDYVIDNMVETRRDHAGRRPTAAKAVKLVVTGQARAATAASPPARTTGASSATTSTAGGWTRRPSARPRTTGSGG